MTYNVFSGTLNRTQSINQSTALDIRIILSTYERRQGRSKNLFFGGINYYCTYYRPVY